MLLDQIETFLRSTRIPPTRFGREALGDPNFVFNLREGRKPRPRTDKRVRLYIKRNKPAERP